MSHSYDTSTYAADASRVPAQLGSPEDLSALSTAAFLEQRKSPDPLVYVSGTTRGGWAIETSTALIEAVDLPSLGFLGEQGHRFETEHGFTVVTVMAPAILPGIASDLRQLLERVKDDPILAMRADRAGCLDGTEDVAAALARDYVSSQPAFDYGNVRGDEGQGADYLFTWLRSILRVIEAARAAGRAVVHELSA